MLPNLPCHQILESYLISLQTERIEGLSNDPADEHVKKILGVLKDDLMFLVPR